MTDQRVERVHLWWQEDPDLGELVSAHATAQMALAAYVSASDWLPLEAMQDCIYTSGYLTGRSMAWFGTARGSDD